MRVVFAAWSAARCRSNGKRTVQSGMPNLNCCALHARAACLLFRVKWLYDNRELIGGLEWVEEPKVLRFFFGRLKPIGDWQQKLMNKFREDFGDSL